MKKVTWILVAGSIMSVPLAVLALGLRAPDGPNPAESARVVRRDIGSVVKATGVVKPRIGAQVRVGSRASGVVAHLHVRIGDAVEKGQLLAELDDREPAARRDQAQAALASARAELDFSVTDLARKRALSASQVIALEELDLAERAQAVARQRAAEASANLALARTQLGFTRITAPISGVVAAISIQEGETVSAGLAAPTFLTLVDLERLEVWAYVDETDIGRIQAGQSAHFTVDTYPDEPFEATVHTVYPQPEIRDNVVNYVTVLEFEAPPGRILRPEMTTTASVDIDRHPNVLAVPRGAIRREPGGTFVYRRSNEQIVKQAVSCGARDGNYWEIVGGLREGDTVVVGRVDSPVGKPE